MLKQYNLFTGEAEEVKADGTNLRPAPMDLKPGTLKNVPTNKTLSPLTTKQSTMAEIRLRDVKEPLIKTLTDIAEKLGQKTNTGAIEKLITSYFDKEKKIKDLQAEVYSLKRELAGYYEREGEEKAMLEDHITNMESQIRGYKALLKTFPKKRNK